MVLRDAEDGVVTAQSFEWNGAVDEDVPYFASKMLSMLPYLI